MSAKTEKHSLVVVGGLHGEAWHNQKSIQWAFNTESWKNSGLEIFFFQTLWHSSEGLMAKNERLIKEIDELSETGLVSLFSYSAGVSLAMIARDRSSHKVHKVAGIYGRLRSGNHTLRSLDRAAASSLAFKTSVLYFELDVEPRMLRTEKQNTYIRQSIIGDELVPKDTSNLPGAVISDSLVIEHGLGILYSIRFAANEIIDFITSPKVT